MSFAKPRIHHIDYTTAPIRWLSNLRRIFYRFTHSVLYLLPQKKREVAIANALIIFITLIAIELLSFTPYRIYYPAPILIALVVFSSMTGGVRFGLLTSIITMAYCYVYFVGLEQSFMIDDKTHDLFIVSSIMSPVIAVIVGILNARSHMLLNEKKYRKKIEGVHKQTTDILESIADGFVAVNKELRFTYVNSKAQKYLGKSADELLGRRLNNALSSRGSVFFKKVEKALTTKKSMVIEDFSPILKMWLRVHIYPTRDGVSIYFNDITEKIESEKRKDDFISIASHELRTPVTSIYTLSQLINRKLEKNTDTSLKKYVTMIEVQADRLVKLCNDLLDVKRLQNQRLALSLERTDLYQLIKQTITTYKNSNDTHTISFSGDPNSMVRIDRERFTQVLVNLLNNAVKYSPDSKRVVARLKSDKSFSTISVRDYGPGIERKHQKNIFSQFYRIKQSAAGGKEGLGLGLYISHEIVKKHGGKLWVESEVGKGSTFFIKLPMRKSIRNAN